MVLGVVEWGGVEPHMHTDFESLALKSAVQVVLKTGKMLKLMMKYLGHKNKDWKQISGQKELIQRLASYLKGVLKDDFQ